MKPMVVLLVLILLLVWLGAVASPARADVSGPAQVVNGDTLMIKGERVGLYGLEAPHDGQTCLRGGEPWPCGEAAAEALRDLIDGRPVWCRRMARDYRERRDLAICYLDSGTGTIEVNAEMVESGMALAHRLYSRRYVRAEAKAKAAERGLWAGRFVPPWDWQPDRQLDANQMSGASGRRPPTEEEIAAEESGAPLLPQ